MSICQNSFRKNETFFSMESKAAVSKDHLLRAPTFKQSADIVLPKIQGRSHRRHNRRHRAFLFARQVGNPRSDVRRVSAQLSAARGNRRRMARPAGNTSVHVQIDARPGHDGPIQARSEIARDETTTRTHRPAGGRIRRARERFAHTPTEQLRVQTELYKMLGAHLQQEPHDQHRAQFPG